MFEVIIHKKVVKFLEKHPKVKKRFLENSIFLKKGDFKKIDIKILTGSNNKYRLRINKYRLLFSIEKEQLIIYFYKADSRGQIYK